MRTPDETHIGHCRVIVALSGGKASAWCADWALKNYPREDVVLYFNDTKWEHPDLYRFMAELGTHFKHQIIVDSDGRNPEELFMDNRALASNQMPFCSRILKAERLQKYYEDGDVLVFGIGEDEEHRAKRIVGVYQLVAAKTGKFPKLIFPLISEKVTKKDIDKFLADAGIAEPIVYKLGFKHNNCAGGCVRAGAAHWALLLNKLPDIYRERERVENRIREHLKKDISYMKDETLSSLRDRIERQGVLFFDNDNTTEECIGICESQA